ncbi:MAG TPA: hypothetical protein VFV03_02235 [Solirubrobacteraceae bacterium]|nr:hypothetical protein [Solirubrobacteraceae bacterium]
MSSQQGNLIETVTLEVRVAGDGDAPVTVAPTIPNDVHDFWAYRVAVMAIGVGLSVFLIGASVIIAVGEKVPDQFWTSGSAISGALIGLLTPSKPAQKQSLQAKRVANKERASARTAVWENLRMLVLLVIFLTAALLGAVVNEGAGFQALAGAAGGALIGLLVPPPPKQQG